MFLTRLWTKGKNGDRSLASRDHNEADAQQLGAVIMLAEDIRQSGVSQRLLASVPD
jgi:hypothetical protein